MEFNQTGESQQTNPVTNPPDSGLMTPQEQPAAPTATPDDAFAALMDSASARMAGLPTKQPEPAPAPQDKPEPAATDKQPEAASPTPAPDAPKPEEKPTQPEGPRIVKLRVDGQEIEVPEDRLVALAQQGVDYTKKSQALAEQRRQVEAWNAVINRVQTDPAFAARFQSLFADPAPQAPAQPQPTQEAPPADPVERLKWEITQAAVAQAKEALLNGMKPVTEQQAAMQHAVRLQSLKADLVRDPAYPEAMQAVRNYVDNQPVAFRQRIYQELDQNPQAFMEVYGRARDHVLSVRQAASRQQAPVQAPTPAPAPEAAPVAPAPQVERKVTPREAPRLESAGQGVTQTTESAARAQTFKALQKKIISGRSTDKDLGDLLVASGAIGRMTRR